MISTLFILLCYSSCSSPVKASANTTITKSSWKHQLEKDAFTKCSVIISHNLDATEIFPHLNSCGLLTTKDCQHLLNKTNNVDKAHYLLTVLPSKEGFFDKFIHCLHETKLGTGHGDIIKALLARYDEIKRGNFQADTAATVSPSYVNANKEVNT